jgi:hypothetical protein
VAKSFVDLYQIFITILRQNKMKKQTNSEEISKIKKQLPGAGAYLVISGMINGAYKPATIGAMLNQHRTMNPGVLQAAQELIDIINQANTQTNEIHE